MSSVATGYWNQFYVDNVSVREFGIRKETPWQEDADSIAEFGTQEEQVVVGGMTDTEALDWQDQILLAMAWPRTFVDVNASPAGDSLKVECNGYVTTLSNTTTVTGASRRARSTSRTCCCTASSSPPGRSRRMRRKCTWTRWTPTAVGLDPDGDGSRWDERARYIGGVYAGRKFDYGPRPPRSSTSIGAASFSTLTTRRPTPSA